MKTASHRLLILLLLTALMLCGCASRPEDAPDAAADSAPDTSRYLVAVEDEPDTVDFQCTSIHYTIAQNVFNRLVEMDSDANGAVTIRPALAKSWEVTDDGRRYTFRLRDGVRFSNGATLTASDVDYTFHRLLTHPDSCNRDIAEEILGADKLAKGEAERLEGFEIIDDLTFAITSSRTNEWGMTTPGYFCMDNLGGEPDETVGIIRNQFVATKQMAASRHTLDGKAINTPQRGINIVRMSDGSVRKVVVK